MHQKLSQNTECEKSPDNPKRWRISISCGRWFSKIIRKRLRIPRTNSETGIQRKEREPQRRISRRQGRVSTWRIRRWRRRSRILLVYSMILSLVVIILNREVQLTCREKNHSLSHKIYIAERNYAEKKYTMREVGWRKAKTSEAKTNLIFFEIAGKGRNSALYYNFAHEFVPMKDLKKALHLISLWRWRQAHVVSSRGTGYLIRGVRDTLTWKPGKKQVWTPSVVLFSELRGVWFRRFWRSVSQRRMPRESEKHKQKIFHSKQCWFQMRKRQWKTNERRS